MHVHSPSLDRLGAALRALRQTDETSGPDKTRLGTKCLAVVIRQLAEEGLSQDDLSPLIDLETELKQGLVRGEQPRDRRIGAPPSDEMLARISAVIDLLVKAGTEEADAAQMLMRKMIGAGMAPPRQGGDARGWKRLLFWRANLTYGMASDAAKAEYRAFTAEIDTIPANERLKRVLDEHLWERRRMVR
jgi:hypothetical protein